MKTKLQAKLQAIELRKKGFSYNEILKRIPVSRSSLSLWLKDVPLSEDQMKYLLKRRLNSWKAGGAARRSKRIQEEENEYQKAHISVGKLSDREVFLIAASLYWAEGAKQRNVISQRVAISNSDPGILLVFYRWLSLMKYQPSDIIATLYLHEVYVDQEQEMLSYWKSYFPDQKLQWYKTVYKREHKKRPFMRYNNARTAFGESLHSSTYYGQLRLEVRKSTRLNRFLAGCSRAITQRCRVV